MKTYDRYQQQILLLIHRPAEVKSISRNYSWCVSKGNRFNFIQSTDCDFITTIKVGIDRLPVCFFHHFNWLMYSDVIPACISLYMISGTQYFCYQMKDQQLFVEFTKNFLLIKTNGQVLKKFE